MPTLKQSAINDVAHLSEYLERKKKKKKEEDIAPVTQKEEDIAPIAQNEAAGEERTWFKKGAFDDGYQAGDITKTILGTAGDVGIGLGKGFGSLVEGVVDLVSYGEAGVADYFGNEEYANKVRKKAMQNSTDQFFGGMEKAVDKYSVLGDKADAVTQGIGQVATIIATGGLAGAAGAGAIGASVATTGLMGASSFGSGMSEAYMGGATDEEAATYGLIKGVVDAGSELLFGGLGKAVKAVGLSKGLSSLDDVLAKKISGKVTNQIAKNFAEYGVKASAEGVEEVIAGIGSAMGKQATYMSDKELSELLADENLLEQFVVGAVTSGIAQSGVVPGMSQGSLKESIKTGRDFITGMTENDQKVVDRIVEEHISQKEADGKKLTRKEKNKVYEDILESMERGEISFDTIAEVLDGDSYKAYKDMVAEEEKAMQEITELYEGDDLQKELADFMEHAESKKVRSELDKKVFDLVKNGKLAESFYERGRRGEAYQADLSKYDEKQRATIQNAINAGVLNNTRRTHEFVDTIAKISADKGVLFDFTNNEKLKDSIFAVGDGKTVNGFVTESGITLNINSAKALNSVVGHEITHVMEGTELYEELQSVLFEYAKGRGATDGKRFDSEYKERLYNARQLYKSVEGYEGVQGFNKIKREVVADLVGDYLFTDADFVNHLVKNRNVFQKVYDEIKYLCKVVTAGSKEARQLEKVKRAFDNAYRGQKNAADGGTKYSLTIKHTDGSVEELSDARGLTNEQAVAYLNQAKSGKLRWDSYIPVRKDTPQVLIDTLAEAGEDVKNLSLVMQVRKAQQSMSVENRGNRAGKHGNNVRKHALIPEEVVEIVNNLDDPAMVILQTNRQDNYGNPRPNNVVVFVEYSNNGNEGVAAIEFESSINPEFIGTEYGDTEYHTVVTVFEPDVERNGIPFDYAEELLSNPDNIELEIKRGQTAESAIGKKHPNTSSELPSFKENVAQLEGNVKKQFSLSESAEETKDLMALHNLQSSELLKTLDLGGLPMPSIAVIKAGSEHEQYGDVSLILPKETIDPKANKDNNVYGGDAWTPTYPRIEYKPNEKIAKKISDKYYGLANEIGYDAVRPMYSYVNELEDTLNRAGGEAAMLEKLYEDTEMMNVYLQDIGKGKVEPVVKETVTEISEVEAEMNQFLIDAMGEDFVVSFKAPAGENPMKYRAAFMEQHESKIRDAYKRYFMEEHAFTQEEADNALDNTTKRDLMKIMREAYMFTQNKGVTVKTETDYNATREAIRNAASEGYKEWVDSLFKGVEGKSGIRNNQDYYTRSGNPRNWDALHWENTLENVVKVMKGQEDTGTGSFSPFNSLFSKAHKRYGSIAEVKADSNRLNKIPEDEYEALKDSFSSRFAAIAESIKDPAERNPFIATDQAGELIVDAVRTQKTKSGMLNYLRKWNSRATAQTVDDVVSLVSDIANMPTGYFEAKPKRAVGLEEVGVFVIPNNADAKLKQELLNRGYSIAEYDPNVEGDRQRVVNGFEEYKFSLSDAGETPKTYGNYNVYGKDIALDAPTQEVVAENASPNTTNASSNTNNAITNASPVLESELFPDDLAPITEEETEAMDDGRLASLEDTDAPPEVEAPTYQTDTITVDDPFENRDMAEVGNRKVKAYMYENPEVKPFFQAEARAMLGELRDTTKGERWYNDHVYYETGGEHGWSGTKRHTSDDIAYLLDNLHYTYDQIEKGLNAIIEDNGAENNAVSKRIEFILNDRLRNGYMDFMSGIEVPPDQGYINLLNEKQITEYSKEAFDALMADADAYAPPISEDIAPVAVEIAGDIAPVAETVPPAPPAPTVEEVKTGKNGEIVGQQGLWPESKVAEVMDTEPETKRKQRNWFVKAMASVADKGFVFENLAKKTKNRVLEGKWNQTLNSKASAQWLMGNGTDGVKSLNAIREEVERTGKTKKFYEYLYHSYIS